MKGRAENARSVSIFRRSFPHRNPHEAIKLTHNKNSIAFSVESLVYFMAIILNPAEFIFCSMAPI